MKGKSILGNTYKENSQHFIKSLIRNHNEIYTPSTKLSPFYECVLKAKYGDLKTNHDYPIILYMGQEEQIAVFEELTIDIYCIHSCIGGKDIQFHYRINPNQKNKIALLKGEKPNSWAWIIPSRSGNLPLIKRRYCGTCYTWLPSKGYSEHVKSCMKCQCGARHKDGDDHEPTCKKKGLSEMYKKDETIRCYKKSKAKKENLSSCFFADFETFPEKQKYVVYAAGIDAKKKLSIFSEQDSLDDFCHHLVSLHRGTLWFFNGGRFDAYFLFKRLVKLGYKIKPDSILKTGNTILSFTIMTEKKGKKGEIDIKDLWRFLPGTLLANCKAFGLPKELWKKDFDHDKIKSWADVEKHKEEYSKYLKYDVLCLKEIYAIYAKKIFEQHSLHVCKYMTASHLFLAAWTITLPKELQDLLLKTPIRDEETMRRFYRGGRIFISQKQWKSKQKQLIKKHRIKITDRKNDPFYQSLAKDHPFYENLSERDKIRLDRDKMEKEGKFDEPYYIIPRKIYDQIKDFCHYLDVNSLYPSVQVKRKYPVGKYKRKNFEKGGIEEKVWLDSIHNQEKKEKATWNRCAVKVSIICPKDLLLAFLMQRNEKGEVTQDLHDKVEEWYTGPELWEAVKLGYKITQIHEIILWERSEEIFDLFVDQAYQAKRKAEEEKNDVNRFCEKMKMNALTGKFAQKLALESIYFVTKQEELVGKTYHHLTEVMDENGEVIGFMATIPQHFDSTSYPVHLSCFILAWSKVFMSRILRNCDGYRNKLHCPKYGDTDSYILLDEAFQSLPKKRLGKNLGQLKSEIPGKIYQVDTIGPKTYSVRYVEEESLRLYSRTRCKGIPHPEGDYDTYSYYETSDLEAAKKHYQDKKENKDCSYADIKERNYFFFKEDKVAVCSRIPAMMFTQILKEKITMEVLFGTMHRDFDYANLDDIQIAPGFQIRTLNKNPYWKRNCRIYLPYANSTDLAYPPGHKDL